MNNISMRLRAIAGQISGLEDLYEAANVIEGLYAATDWVDKIKCFSKGMIEWIPAGAIKDDEKFEVTLTGAEIRALIDARRKARGE